MIQEPNILIVDDEPNILKTLSEALVGAGYKIRTAQDGKTAIRAVSRTRYNLVILDIALPDIDGMEVLRKIKKISPEVEVVIITGHATVENSVNALNEGAYAYILKPFNPAEVKTIIRKAIAEQKKSLEKEQLLKDLQKSYQELEQSRDELIQSEKLTFAGRMAASVAHEIRNPLNIISMAVQQLHNELSKRDRRREYTKIVVGNIERVNKLITELVNAARPPKMKMQQKDVNKNIEDVFKSIQPKLQKMKTRVTYELDKSLPKIKIDSDHMTQAFANILLNACDALPKRGGRISITSKKDGDYAVIKFKNKGSIIPKKDLIRIFDPFYSTKRTGAGLGLSIVYTVIGSHRGTIGVESNKKIGTVFTVKLPL